MNETSPSSTGTPPAAPGGDDRPGLAFVQHAPAPYRTHLQRRIVREIPELKLLSIYTHGFLVGHEWRQSLPDEINPVHFGHSNEVAEESSIKHPIREFRKGTRLVRYAREHNIQAAILYGYRRHSMRRLTAALHRAGAACFFYADSNVRNPEPATAVHHFIKRLWLVPTLRKCTGILSMGELGDQYFDRYGGDPSRYFRVPNEPDYDSIANVTDEQIEAFRTRFGLRADRSYILFSGRLLELKRVDLLIDAFARIAADRPAWDMVILGDGPMRGALEARVPPESPELRARVHWLGYLDMDLVPAAYHATDLLVLPSDQDAWGLVVNEAMAAGSPVIASDVVGAAWEMVRDQGCGRLFAKGDLDGLVDALSEVTDPRRYEAYRAAVGPALQRWRRVADPINGIRAALSFAGIIPREPRAGSGDPPPGD
jgi:glycosyltransferase involved in cell wall biosynthesis